MQTYKQKREEGFTIIEVLIVLAIAGLILLIVFLAVPALQRNSRNTQRKNDVAAILGAINEWQNNNNGDVPGNQTELDDAIENANLSIYEGVVNYNSNPTFPGDENSVNVTAGYKCDPNNPESGTTESARSVVALYRVEEGGGGAATQCD